MPNRILRDGILSSEAVSSLSWAEEVFYRRLMSVADDHGRFHASPKLIRAACYPLLIDKVSDADIGKWLTSCVTAALVSVYPAADGKRYLQITKFGQQMRSASKYPVPTDGGLLAIDSSRQQVISTAHLVGVGVGDVKNSEAKASDGKPAGDEVESEKAALWRESVVVLKAGGCPESLCRSFMGKLVKDYTEPTVREAVTAAISAQPADAREYLKATCQRLKGERRDPITVPSTDKRADEFSAAMDERAATATKPPAALVALVRRHSQGEAA